MRTAAVARTLSLLCVAIVIAFISESASAQTATVPTDSAGPCGITAERPPAAELGRVYHSGDWIRFQNLTRSLLKQLQGDCQRVAPATGDFVVVIWLAKPPVGDRSVFAAIVPPLGFQPALEPFQLLLPGVGTDGTRRVRQVFVADSAAETVAAVYASTRQRNPLTEQIPAVAAAVVEPLLALSSLTRGRIAAERAASRGLIATPRANGWLTVSTVTLPFERASIELHLRALAPPSPQGLSDAAAELAARLRLLDLRYSACAGALADELRARIDERKAECEKGGLFDPECLSLAALDPAFDAAYDKQVKACGGSAGEGDSLQLVDQKFRTLLFEPGEALIPGKVDLKNTPPERFSFGIVSGVLVSTFSSAPRVTVDEGVLVADPIGRQINMVVLNGSFRSYNPAAFDLSARERLRWFAGAVVTPSFGVGGGVSVLVVRGLAINAGAAVLGVTGAADGQAIGSPPLNVNDPYKLEAAGGFFLGASYNFK